jgi:hypothetical protein
MVIPFFVFFSSYNLLLLFSILLIFSYAVIQVPTFVSPEKKQWHSISMLAEPQSCGVR